MLQRVVHIWVKTITSFPNNRVSLSTAPLLLNSTVVHQHDVDFENGAAYHVIIICGLFSSHSLVVEV